MIELYYWTTPNGHKLTMMLEECALPFRIIPVNISKGDQFKPDFLRISPNNKIPAMVDLSPNEGNAPVSLFESGAMLQYLAEKSGKFLPKDLAGRANVMQWLFWQMAGLGPMAGQLHHFKNYAAEKLPSAIGRYVNETNRLYGVLDTQLEGQDYIAGNYSIADMASYPWARLYEGHDQDISEFPNLKAWLEKVAQRPATVRAFEIAKSINTAPSVTEEGKSILFNQTAKALRKHLQDGEKVL